MASIDWLMSCTYFRAQFFGIFCVIKTRKTLNLNVSLSLHFEASLLYFWSFNLIATRELFFSDHFGGDVFTLAQNSLTYIGMSSINWLMINSAEEDSKVKTGPENGLFWLKRLDRYSTISTILNFHCETAREVPLQGMGSMLNLDTFSWQESPCKLYIYVTEFAKTWLKKFQVHFNDLTSKSNGKHWKVTS